MRYDYIGGIVDHLSLLTFLFITHKHETAVFFLSFFSVKFRPWLHDDEL